MLRELSIENLAVIEKASVEFGGAFNVFTGETGISAGKYSRFIIPVIFADSSGVKSTVIFRTCLLLSRISKTRSTLALSFICSLERFGSTRLNS